MKAVVAERPGGPEVLSATDLPTPEPRSRQLLVAVAASGVNFIDTYRRTGVYPVPFPHTIGLEGAGTVVDTGSEVTEFAPGDRVAWSSAPGSSAQFVVVDDHRAVLVPEGVELEIAAAAMLQGLTAHYLAHSTFPLGESHTTLIHAGAGGVGLLLTQFAAALGARVFTTVSSPDKARLSRQAGAAEAIRYDQLSDLTEELPALVRSMTEGRGVNVVYDGVGRSTFDASLASICRRGTLVLFGGSSGQVLPFDLQRLNSAGSLYVTRPSLDDYTAERTEFQWRAAELFRSIDKGTLNVRVSARYSLAEASQAHADLEGRRTTGKLLLVP